jgi:hypothetical protein
VNYQDVNKLRNCVAAVAQQIDRAYLFDQQPTRETLREYLELLERAEASSERLVDEALDLELAEQEREADSKHRGAA